MATGDLVQDQSPQAYQHFADGIARIPAPCVWLPGNHDYPPAMVKTLRIAGISSAKQVLIGDEWQILMLDSQLQDVPHGELSEQQLEWMKASLDAEPERTTLIMLHHHPLASGCTWLDQHSLRNSHILADYLKATQMLKRCYVAIFTKKWMKTGTVFGCWQRLLPVCNLSLTVLILRLIPSRQAGDI